MFTYHSSAVWFDYLYEYGEGRWLEGPLQETLKAQQMNTRGSVTRQLTVTELLQRWSEFTNEDYRAGEGAGLK